MASGSKRWMTGVITATVFVLAIGGLAAYGAGYFDQDSDTSGTATQPASGGECCPFTGCSDEAENAIEAVGADAGGCPSTSKGCAEQAAPDDCCGNCEDPAAGCDGQDECDGQEDCGSKSSCGSCPTDN